MSKVMLSKRKLFQNRLFRLLVIEFFALSISLFFIATFFVISGPIVGYLYGIPEPRAGVDDLGWGVLMAAVAFASLLISLPISALIHVYAFKKFL